MSIIFHHTIMHLLDLSLEIPVLSAKPLVLTDDTEAFILKHILRLFEDPSVSAAVFNTSSEFPNYLLELNTRFYDASCELAKYYFKTILNSTNIPSGDLLIVAFSKDSRDYIALLKFNYKEEYTHYVEASSSGNINQIIKHKAIFPSAKQKIDEAILIDLETLSIRLSDSSKKRYLSTFLDCKPSLSVKEQIKVVNHVVHEAIASHFDNHVEALSQVKHSIAESIIDTSSIPIDSILEETFTEHKEILEDCRIKLEEYGLTEHVIELDNPTAIEKKYTMHKLKTNTGIELKFPTQLLQNQDTIEFINNPNGSISILIKNISQIINK